MMQRTNRLSRFVSAGLVIASLLAACASPCLLYTSDAADE